LAGRGAEWILLNASQATPGARPVGTAPVRDTKDPAMAREIPDRVMVVDGEPLIRWALCTALAAAGFDVVGAEDAVAALRLAAERPSPRVAVLDWGPVEKTPEHVLEMRRICPNCRFVLMTTADRRDLVAPRSWAAVVVDKPFDLARVVTVVRDGVEGKGDGPLDLRKGA